MKPLKKLVTTLSVDIALRALDVDGVRKVHTWFDRLKNWDNDESVRTRSQRLEEFSGVYVLQTNTDLWIFFRVEGNTITLLDIANRATIVSSGAVPEAD